jgi:hypothetical protein
MWCPPACHYPVLEKTAIQNRRENDHFSAKKNTFYGGCIGGTPSFFKENTMQLTGGPDNLN